MKLAIESTASLQSLPLAQALDRLSPAELSVLCRLEIARTMA